MRRMLMIAACLGVLCFAGTTTALARGPNQRPQIGHHGYGHGPQRGPYQAAYRGGHRPFCPPPRRRVAAYPAYAAPVYAAYPQLGFGVAGRNFSFWLQR